MSSSLANRSNNIVWKRGLVSHDQRCQLLGQEPLTIWLTGLSASGKTTLAYTLERILFDMGRACYVLDGDHVRHGLSRDLDFSHEGRSENIRRVSEVARLMNDAGLIVISAFISPYKDDRKRAQDIIGRDQFFEVYISTPQKICEERDPKGMYGMARAGQINEFTGVSSPYEPPQNPVCMIDTSKSLPDECARQVLAAMSGKIVLSNSHHHHEGDTSAR